MGPGRQSQNCEWRIDNSGHNYYADCGLPRMVAVFCPHRRTKGWRIRNGLVPASRGCRRYFTGIPDLTLERA